MIIYVEDVKIFFKNIDNSIKIFFVPVQFDKKMISNYELKSWFRCTGDFLGDLVVHESIIARFAVNGGGDFH